MSVEATIDMRSDTVTKPTEEMRNAFLTCPVGDDVFGDDPTVNQLEETAARLFGKEAALFVPTGTMGNLISVLVHCEARGSEMILGDNSHIFIYEQGGSAHLGGVHPRTVPTNPDGTLDLAAIEAAIRPDNVHFPVTRLICLESTHNMKGGRVLPLSYIESVGELAKKHKLFFHLDGARVMNALAVLNIEPARYVQQFDSVNICLSKGLGAPAGSVVVGTKDFIAKARRMRKVLGGGMRQAGIIAAAGLIALTEMPKKLPLDHEHIQLVYKGVLEMGAGIEPVGDAPHTNMLFVQVSDASRFVALMKERNILLGAINDKIVRFVTHHQITRPMIDRLLKEIPAVLAELAKQ